MGVDCSAVSGYGIELTEDVLDKLIAAGLFTRDEWGGAKEGCLYRAGFSSGIAGSYYTGDTIVYLLVDIVPITELVAAEMRFIATLESIGVTISIDDIEEISEVLWW